MKRLGWVGLLFFVAGIVLSAEAKEADVYESRAKISVVSTSPSVDPLSGAGQVVVSDPDFINSQIKIMTSRFMLEEVVDQLNLQKRWAEGEEELPLDQAVQRLQGGVKIYPIGGKTSSFLIAAIAGHPQLAADIANTIAKAYSNYCMALIVDDERRETIKEMVEVRERQAEALANAWEVERKIRMVNPEVVDVLNNIDGWGRYYNLQQLEVELLANQREMIEIEAKLGLLAKCSVSNAMEMTSSITVDVTVLNAVQRIGDIEAEIKTLGASIGETHPEYVRLENEKKQWSEYLLQRLEGLHMRLQTEYDIAKDRNEDLNDALTRSMKIREYENALADGRRAKKVYDALGEDLRQLIIRSGTPTRAVEIYDRAMPRYISDTSLSVRSSDSAPDESASGEVAYQLKRSMLAKERLEAVLKSGDQAAIDAALKDLDEALNVMQDAVE